ncbi:MAG: hypothetical protein AAB870_05310, partial [Patescibacteria group bacterium]
TVPNSAPTAPTTLYANTSANTAQSGTTNPDGVITAALTSTSVVFSAIHNDPDSNAANKYQLQIDNDNDFSSVLYDSENTGLAGTSMTSTNNAARSPDISILPSGGAVTNLFTGGVPALNVPYYWRIKFWDTNNAAGVFSASGGANVFKVVSPPAAPAASGSGLAPSFFSQPVP